MNGTSMLSTNAPLQAGNASMLAMATIGLSGNKYILGLMILLINIGARYIGNEVGDFMHKVLNHKFSRRFLIFLVLWMGTRDLVVAGVITIAFIVIVSTIFNEHSDYCILPIDNTSSISKEDYLMAKELISKYEKDNEPSKHTMNNGSIGSIGSIGSNGSNGSIGSIGSVGGISSGFGSSGGNVVGGSVGKYL